MINELLIAQGSIGTFMLALIIFGFAPGMVLALIVRLIPDVDRRKELQAELYEVPRWDRPFWVVQQFEVALRVGLPVHIEWFWGRYVWHRCTLESGLERHTESPDTFEIPDHELKSLIRPRDQVKLMWSVARSPGERMWVTVTHRKGDQLVGTLENHAFFVFLNPGERVKFHLDDIIDCIIDEEDIESSKLVA